MILLSLHNSLSPFSIIQISPNTSTPRSMPCNPRRSCRRRLGRSPRTAGRTGRRPPTGRWRPAHAADRAKEETPESLCGVQFSHVEKPREVQRQSHVGHDFPTDATNCLPQDIHRLHSPICRRMSHNEGAKNKTMLNKPVIILVGHRPHPLKAGHCKRNQWLWGQTNPLQFALKTSES